MPGPVLPRSTASVSVHNDAGGRMESFRALSSMQAAVDVAERMAKAAPEVVEQPKAHFTPTRLVYDSKKRKTKRLASQAKGLYTATATHSMSGKRTWAVLAQGPKRVLSMLLSDKTISEAYYDFKIKRICGVTAGTKERIL